MGSSNRACVHFSECPCSATGDGDLSLRDPQPHKAVERWLTTASLFAFGVRGFAHPCSSPHIRNQEARDSVEYSVEMQVYSCFVDPRLRWTVAISPRAHGVDIYYCVLCAVHVYVGRSDLIQTTAANSSAPDFPRSRRNSQVSPTQLICIIKPHLRGPIVNQLAICTGKYHVHSFLLSDSHATIQLQLPI